MNEPAKSAIAPLLAQLAAECTLTSTGLSVLVFGGFDFITGQLTYAIPHSPLEIEKALKLPTLAPLLQTSVSFSATVLFSVSLVFANVGVQQRTPPLQLIPGRRLLQQPEAQPTSSARLPSPGAWLGDVDSFLASANASVESQALVARFSPLRFDSISAGVWTGLVERQTARFDAVLRKPAVQWSGGSQPWWSASGLFQKTLTGIVGGSTFFSVGVTVSANEALTATIAQKNGSAGGAVAPLTGTGTRGL